MLFTYLDSNHIRQAREYFHGHKLTPDECIAELYRHYEPRFAIWWLMRLAAEQDKPQKLLDRLRAEFPVEFSRWNDDLLAYAIAFNNKPAVDCILDLAETTPFGCVPPGDGKTPVQLVVKKGDIDLLWQLVRRFDGSYKFVVSVLYNCACSGAADIYADACTWLIERLCKKERLPNRQYEQLITEVLFRYKSARMTKILFDAWPPEPNNMQHVFWAFHGDDDCLDLLRPFVAKYPDLAAKYPRLVGC